MAKKVNIQINQKGKTVAQGLYDIGRPNEQLKTPDEKEGLLRRFFKFGKRKKEDGTLDYIGLTKHQTKDKKGDVRLSFTPESWDSYVESSYQYWKRQTAHSKERYESISQLYDDMDEMFLNNAYMAKALKYRVAETLQQDLNMQPIGVEADKKQKKHILEFFERVGIQNLLPEAITGRAKYGNHGWLLIPSSHGIEEIISINARDIEDILMFSASETDREILSGLRGNFTDSERGDTFIDVLLEKKDIGAKFRKHLLGYQVGGELIPPWQFVMFRNEPNNSVWAPFGVPIFIHSLSAYRKYDFIESMEAMAFGLRFPVEKFKFNIPNNVEPTEAFYKVADIMNQLNNSGLIIDTNFEQGLGRKVVTIQNLYEYEIQELNVDWGETGNREAILNELIASTFLPKGQIDPRDTQYAQQSGKALVQDFKPFAREIFLDQQSILETVTTAVKIDMIQSGKFSLSELNFTLTMPYPESQINTDIISSQESQFGLAKAIIEDLSEFMGIQDKNKVPIELVKDVFTQILPYDDSRIYEWLKVIDKEREKFEGDELGEFGGGDTASGNPFNLGGDDEKGGGLDDTGGEEEPIGGGEEEAEAEPEENMHDDAKKLTAGFKDKRKKFYEKTLKGFNKKLKEIKKNYNPLLEGLDGKGKHFYNSKKSGGVYNDVLTRLIEVEQRILDNVTVEED